MVDVDLFSSVLVQFSSALNHLWPNTSSEDYDCQHQAIEWYRQKEISYQYFKETEAEEETIIRLSPRLHNPSYRSVWAFCKSSLWPEGVTLSPLFAGLGRAAVGPQSPAMPRAPRVEKAAAQEYPEHRDALNTGIS